MNNKSAIQAVISVAVIALILIISRLFLTDVDRDSLNSFLVFSYDLSETNQAQAFLSVVVSSVLGVVIGYFLVKESYKMVGNSIINGSAVALLFATILVYFSNSATFQGGQGGSLYLTVALGLEWMGLIIYTQKQYPALKE